MPALHTPHCSRLATFSEMAHSLGNNALLGSRSAARSSVTRPRLQRCPPAAVFSRNPTPPDAPQDSRPVGREWLESILSRFGPAKDRAQNITTLEFEKPLLELDKRIKEVGCKRSYNAHHRCALQPV